MPLLRGSSNKTDTKLAADGGVASMARMHLTHSHTGGCPSAVTPDLVTGVSCPRTWTNVSGPQPNTHYCGTYFYILLVLPSCHTSRFRCICKRNTHLTLNPITEVVIISLLNVDLKVIVHYNSSITERVVNKCWLLRHFFQGCVH